MRLRRLPGISKDSLIRLLWIAFVVCAGTRNAAAQPFVLTVQQGGTTLTVAQGASITIAAGSGGTAGTATVTATYSGTGSAVINSVALSGSATFSLVSPPTFPMTLSAGGSVSLTVQYQPGAGGESSQLTISYHETTTTGTTAGAMFLTLTGAVSNLQVSYAVPPTQNIVPLSSGGTVQFPPTVVNANTTATIVIANRGASPGMINSVLVSGAAFQAQSLPLLPFTLAGNSFLQFGVKYSPTQVGNDTGTISIDLGGVTFQANLAGSGTSSKFSYQVMSGTTSTTVLPNQTITVPDTNVGTPSSVTIQIQNTGAAAGAVTSISVSGTGFTVTDAAPLPITLNPNDTTSFTLNFLPTQAGPATGHLRVGNDQFTLASNGLGPKLIYSYQSGTSVTVQPGGGVFFSPVQVGQTSKLPFTISNQGTTAATVSSVAVSDTHGIFTFENLPPLPVTLNPGDSTGFTIDFSPAVTGVSTSTLQIDTATFTLSGSGTAPPPLPNVQFTGASGNVDPSGQPGIGLSLAAPYPVALSGTVVMTIDSGSLGPDAAAQFATGGKTVAFTIAANSLQATFQNGANQIRLQTGTTAGTLTLTPTISTQSGVGLILPTPTALTLTIPAEPPQILGVAVSNVTATGFTLAVRGFSTTHVLTALGFQFTSSSDVKTSAGPISVDISAPATTWYNSSQSLNFGGQFVVTIPFTVSSSVSSPASKIQGVTVTATNDKGNSTSFQTTIP